MQDICYSGNQKSMQPRQCIIYLIWASLQRVTVYTLWHYFSTYLDKIQYVLIISNILNFTGRLVISDYLRILEVWIIGKIF